MPGGSGAKGAGEGSRRNDPAARPPVTTVAAFDRIPAMYALMTAIRDTARVYPFAGRKTSVRIDLGGCAADA